MKGTIAACRVWYTNGLTEKSLALALYFLVALQSSCSVISPTVTDMPPPKEASTAPLRSSPGTPASLWNDNGELARLYVDNRASRVGDIVTIRIVESATGAKSATTKTAKDSSFEDTFKGNFSNFFYRPSGIFYNKDGSGIIKYKKPVLHLLQVFFSAFQYIMIY